MVIICNSSFPDLGIRQQALYGTLVKQHFSLIVFTIYISLPKIEQGPIFFQLNAQAGITTTDALVTDEGDFYSKNFG